MFDLNTRETYGYLMFFIEASTIASPFVKYSLQGTTQSRYLTGGVPPVRFSM